MTTGSQIVVAVLFIAVLGGRCGAMLNDQPKCQDEEPKIILKVNRYLGFRSVDEVTEDSDYSFQLNSDGRWTYRPMKSGEESTGKIASKLNEIVAAVQAIRVPEEKAESPGPQVADAPSFKMTILQRDEGDEKPQVKSLEVFPKTDLAMMLHQVIQDWRDGKATLPKQMINLIEVEGLDAFAKRERFEEPKIFETRDELKSFAESEKLVDLICEQVDFESQKLLLFSWSGSGQDRLEREFDLDHGKVTFKIVGGRTRDFRSHVKLFVVENDTEIEISK